MRTLSCSAVSPDLLSHDAFRFHSTESDGTFSVAEVIKGYERKFRGLAGAFAGSETGGRGVRVTVPGLEHGSRSAEDLVVQVQTGLSPHVAYKAYGNETYIRAPVIMESGAVSYSQPFFRQA